MLRGLGFGEFQYIGADPPYGDIMSDGWDSVDIILKTSGRSPTPSTREQMFIDWMLDWTRMWSEVLHPSGAMYVWGGIGKPRFRPFYGYLSQVEKATGLTLVNHITWKKKRAYGKNWDYLFTREEIAWLCKGDPKKDHVFNVPLLDVKRGYAGYDAKYPAKSEFKRRTNVWPDTADWDLTVWDETEILRGKRGPCQKARRVNEIPLEVHTRQGDAILDLFAGTGSLSKTAGEMGRRWVAIESRREQYQSMVEWLLGPNDDPQGTILEPPRSGPGR
jgi:DNA modification methylase